MPRLAPVEEEAGRRAPPDLRAVVLGVSAWAGGLAVLGLPGWTWPVVAVLGSLWVLSRHRRGRPVVTLLACLLAAAAVGGVTALHVEANRGSPVAALARQGAVATLTARVSSDPVLRTGRFGAFTLTRVTVSEVAGRGHRHRTGVPVLVIGDASWKRVELGSRVTTTGRLARAGRAGPGGGAVHRPAAARAEPAGGGAVGRRAGARRDPCVGRRCDTGGAGPGPRARRRRRPGAAGPGRRGLPHLRADPPGRGLRHQPDAGRRLPARRGALGRDPGAGTGRRRRARGGRLRAARPARAERAPRGRDGVRGAGRAGCPGQGHRRPGARCRGAGAAPARPVARPVPVGSCSRLWRPRGSCSSGRRSGTPCRAGCRAGRPRRSRSRSRPSSPARPWWRRSPAR